MHGRLVRLGNFTSQPLGLLTAICDRNERVDLLVVAPDTASGIAAAAMIQAATTTDLVHAQDILRAVSTPALGGAVGNAPEDAWETDGGRGPRGCWAPHAQEARIELRRPRYAGRR